MTDRRQVRMVSSVPIKTSGTFFATGAAQDCSMYSLAKIPYDYVPPPENVAMATVPYKWPTDEDWSRSISWDPAKYQR